MSLNITASQITSNYSTTLLKGNLSTVSQDKDTSETDGASASVQLSKEGLAASKAASSDSSSSQNLSGLTEGQLNDLLEAGSITQQQVAAELARRKVAESENSSSQLNSKIANAIEAYKVQTDLSIA